MSVQGKFVREYYRKSDGRPMLQYYLTGTDAELTEYAVIVAAGRNITPEDLTRDSNNNLLFNIPTDFIEGSGYTPQNTITLVKTWGDKGYAVDHTEENKKRRQRVEALSDEKEATIKAELRLGLRQKPVFGSNRTVAKKEVAAEVPAEELDDSVESLMKSTKPLLVPEGNETLEG